MIFIICYVDLKLMLWSYIVIGSIYDYIIFDWCLEIKNGFMLFGLRILFLLVYYKKIIKNI